MADIFVDLLAQYLGSIMVVQPLLPSFFAPLPPLADAETTLLLSDEYVDAPTEVTRLTEATVPPRNAAPRRSPDMAALSTPAMPSMPPESAPAIPLRQILHGPQPVVVQNQPSQGMGQTREVGTAEISPISQSWQHVDTIEDEEAATLASAHGPRVQPPSPSQEIRQQQATSIMNDDLPMPLQEKLSVTASIRNDYAPTPSPKKQPQVALQEVQPRPRVQRDEVAAVDEFIGPDAHHAFSLPECAITSDAYQAPTSSQPVLQPSQLTSHISEPASAQIQPLTPTPTASPPVIQRKAAVAQEHVEKLARPHTPPSKRLHPATSAIAPAPAPRSVPAMQAALPARSELVLPEILPSIALNVSQTSSALSAPTAEETPRAARHLAQTALPAPMRTKHAAEKPTEKARNDASSSFSAPLEQPMTRILPKQEATVPAEEEREQQPIRVHIGRIVVRGTTGTPHTAPTSPAKRTLRPALSLNEYLKQRERGSR